jgi:hypothetical protein
VAKRNDLHLSVQRRDANAVIVEHRMIVRELRANIAKLSATLEHSKELERCMFSPAVWFRVVSSFVAFGTSATNSLVTVPIGSIIATRQEMRDPGLVKIRLNHQRLLAFRRDIQERAEPIDERARAARLGIGG